MAQKSTKAVIAQKTNATKANATKAKIPFADDIIDASHMTPEEIKAQRTLELKMKFDNEEGAKLRAQAKNLTKDIRKTQGICKKCSGPMCPYFAGFCEQMCGMPCTR